MEPPTAAYAPTPSPAHATTPSPHATLRRAAWSLATAFAAAVGALAFAWAAGAPAITAAKPALQPADPAALQSANQLPGADMPSPELLPAVRTYLQLEGVEGDVMAPGLVGAIEVLSWSFGESRPNASASGAGGGGGAGKVQVHDISITKTVDKASPVLFKHCATGRHIKEATLTVRKAGRDQQEYLVVKFTDLLITSYQVGGSSGGDLPGESLSLNFTKVEYKFFPANADGTSSAPIQSSHDFRIGR